MIKGVVQKILVNPQYGLTSFTMKGQDGFFSLGKDKPSFKEGDPIQFETNVVGKYTYAKDIAPWTDGGTTSGANVGQVAAAASGFQRGGGRRGNYSGGGDQQAKEQYWRDKEARDIAKEGEYALTQRRIEIQAARNAAIETAKAMWQFDVCPKPKKATEHYDTFLALVDELADKYLANTSSRLERGVGSVVERGNGETAEAVPASKDEGNWD